MIAVTRRLTTNEVRVRAWHKTSMQGRETAHHPAQNTRQIRWHASERERVLRLLKKPKRKTRTGKRLAQKDGQGRRRPASWSAWIDAQ